MLRVERRRKRWTTCSPSMVDQTAGRPWMVWYTNQGATSSHDASEDCRPCLATPSNLGSDRRQFQAGGADHGREEEGRDELRHEPEEEVGPTAAACARARPGGRLGPPEVMVEAARVAQHDGGLHVVAADAVDEEQVVERVEGEQGGDAAGPPGQPPAERKHVKEGDAAEQGVAEPEAEVVVRQQAEPDRQRDDPELQRRLLEEHDVCRRRQRGFSQSPVSRMLSAA